MIRTTNWLGGGVAGPAQRGRAMADVLLGHQRSKVRRLRIGKNCKKVRKTIEKVACRAVGVDGASFPPPEQVQRPVTRWKA